MPYMLHISFRSNERPFKTNYEPARAIDGDSDAWRWHDGMKEGLGGAYDITLLKDGIPLVREAES